LPQEKQPTPLPSNPIKWLAAIWSIDPKTVLYANGLDAYVFVRLCRMFLWIFLVAMPLTWAVLMPVTAIKPNQGQTGLNMFVIGESEWPCHGIQIDILGEATLESPFKSVWRRTWSSAGSSPLGCS
jgi:hypothetical protein